MRKVILAAVLALVGSVAMVAAAVAAVSSPCSGYTKPVVVKKEAPVRRPSKPIDQTYKRNVLGQKIPVYTHIEGNAATDTATKYEDELK
jgi:cell division septation protein DedD